MSIPTNEPMFSSENAKPAKAQRRRRSRVILPPGDQERTAFLEQIIRLVTPGYDLYLFTLISAVVFVIAVLSDARGLFFLAALLVPFLGPVFGLSWGPVIGSGRFFLKQLGGLLLSCGLFFGISAIGGTVSRWFTDAELSQIFIFSSISWSDFIVVAVGVGLGTYMLARSPRQKPLVASVAVAYELLLPLGAAGIGLTSGKPGLWMDGLLIFLIYLAWAVLVGFVFLLGLGFYPKNSLGKILASVVVLVGIAVVTVMAFADSALPVAANITPIPTLQNTQVPAYSNTPVIALPTLTGTPQPTQTHGTTIIPSIQPSRTFTASVTPEPTTVFARVFAPQGDGAFVREEPGGTILSSLLNGNEVEVISAPQRDQNNQVWVKVRTSNGVEGWMVQELLATETPTPRW